MDSDSEPFQLVTTPLMEVDSEPQGTKAKDPERPPPPVQPSSYSAAKVINLNEIIAQSFEDGFVSDDAAMGAVPVMLGENDHAAPQTKAPVWV